VVVGLAPIRYPPPSWPRPCFTVGLACCLLLRAIEERSFKFFKPYRHFFLPLTTSKPPPPRLLASTVFHRRANVLLGQLRISDFIMIRNFCGSSSTSAVLQVAPPGSTWLCLATLARRLNGNTSVHKKGSFPKLPKPPKIFHSDFCRDQYV